MLRIKILIWTLLCLYILCISCNDVDKTNPVNPDTQNTDDRTVFGTIMVSLIAPQGTSSGYTSVLGKVYDGPTPQTVIWEVAATSGECKLLTPRVPFCNQTCESGAMCVEDDSCQSYPSAIDMGTLTITGLLTRTGETTISMDPLLHGYQPTGGVIIDFPPFIEGDLVTASATGDTGVSAFTVNAVGIAPLEVLSDSIVLEDGKPIELEWTPPAQPGNSKIHVVLDISHHGGVKGKIECDCEDDGYLEISPVLVDALKALGMSGYPKIDITRSTTGSTTPASVDLIIKSTVTKELHIPGLVSCSGDDGCPDGQTCQWDLRCE